VIERLRHRRRRGVAAKAWLTLGAVVVALSLSAIRCARDVTVGVAPGSDASIDGPVDGGAG
jgi:hypothetical protein